MVEKIHQSNESSFISRTLNKVQEKVRNISLWLDANGNNDGEFNIGDVVTISKKTFRTEQTPTSELTNDNLKNNKNAKEIKNVKKEKHIYKYNLENTSVETIANDSVKVKRTVLPEIKGIENIVDKKTNEFSFILSRSAMEDYIINAADSPHFRSIKEIKEKLPAERTPEEAALLEELNNLLDYITNSGLEYGVDPNLILSIIQQEVKFNGLSSKVTGENGKGYMQITSAPIRDFLGYYKKDGKGQYSSNKINIYGQEMADLLKSRGFNVDCENKDKEALCSDIRKYLKENKDPEFNIKLGTLILRRCMVRAKGDPRKAARLYNGNTSLSKDEGKRICDIYANRVNKYYHNLELISVKSNTEVT